MLLIETMQYIYIQLYTCDRLCLLINVLKAAGVSAETMELGREFQTATMRFEKKFLRIFNLVRGIKSRISPS